MQQKTLDPYILRQVNLMNSYADADNIPNCLYRIATYLELAKSTGLSLTDRESKTVVDWLRANGYVL